MEVGKRKKESQIMFGSESRNNDADCDVHIVGFVCGVGMETF